MRQNRCPGENLFVDYAGIAAPVLVDGKEHQAQRCSSPPCGCRGGSTPRPRLPRKIEDWCASPVRCFQNMGWVLQLMVSY